MILLDTHIWIWWRLGSERLRPALGRRIDRTPAERRFVSTMSLWETAQLVTADRAHVPGDLEAWLGEPAGTTAVGVDAAIAAATADLPGSFHRDPMDQLIVATARVRSLKLVTVDARILAYPHVETVG